jgi:hypothetical protein
MGSSTGVAFHQLHPQPQEVLAQGLEAPGAAKYVAASPVSWPGPPRRREPAAGQPGRHATPRQRSAGEANIANADVVVGHLVAAPNVGNGIPRHPEGALSHTPADEDSNDIGEVAPAYGSRGNVSAAPRTPMATEPSRNPQDSEAAPHLHPRRCERIARAPQC